jgi:hypothetical protein
MKTARKLVLSALLLQACTQAAIAECRVPTRPDISFLPRTTEPKVLMPWGAGIGCQIYQWAWQNFLFVTQSDGTGATFLNYPTFEDAFKIKASPLFPDKRHGSLSLAPRDSKSPKDIGVIEHQRALPRHVLIDQAGNPIWYAIHVNDKYIQFLRDYRLTDPTVLGNLHPLTDLAFRHGVVELKSAWKIVDGTNAPKNYITSKARIPVFKNDNGTIVTDGERDVTVALLALHVAGVIEGHPEFIWATFEHVNHETNGDWRRDVAPAANSNPDHPPIRVETRTANYTLYPVDPNSPSAPPVAGANVGGSFDSLTLDERTQKFSPPTPVYRIFPASKSEDTEEDAGVRDLNKSVQDAFKGLSVTDVRSNYELVGAVWLATPWREFQPGREFSDDSMFGGQNRLSNMAIESFTQSKNCFSCHNTRERLLDASSNLRLEASKLNVSRLLSIFLELSKR